jgi:hypothetical protein
MPRGVGEHHKTYMALCKLRVAVNPARALDNFQPEEYVTSSVLGQGVFDSPSLTLVIGARNFQQIVNTFRVIRYLESYYCIIRWIKLTRGSFSPPKIVVKTYLMSHTPSLMRFWHFKCVKYANKPFI